MIKMKKMSICAIIMVDWLSYEYCFDQIEQFTFNKISDILNNNLEVGKYVKFSDYKNTYGI